MLRGGSFKIETLVAYRAEQRPCLEVTPKPSVLRSNSLSICHIPHLKWSHCISVHLIASHCIFCHFISVDTQLTLISSWFTSSHLTSSVCVKFVFSCHLSPCPVTASSILFSNFSVSSDIMSPQLISHLALPEPTSSQLISVTSSSSKTTCPLFIYLGTLHAHPVLLHLMSIHLISHLIFSCQTSLKNCKLRMWKQSFRARLPSKTESWRCENEAFPSLKTWKLKMWKRARHPSFFLAQETCKTSIIFLGSSCAKRRLKRQFPTMIPVQPRPPRNRRAANLPIHLPRHVLSCKT